MSVVLLVVEISRVVIRTLITTRPAACRTHFKLKHHSRQPPHATMPRHSIDTERGSAVQLGKRKRVAAWADLLRTKILCPALSLRQLAQMRELGSRSAERRWRKYEAARAEGRTEAEAVERAAGDARGGHNRTFTREQSSLLADIVRAATPSMTHKQIHDEALQLHQALHTYQHQLRSVPSPLSTFHASNQFVTRFKRQHDLASHRTAVAYQPKAKAGQDRDKEYLDFVTEVHGAVLQYGARLVLNMDETAISKIDPPTTAVVAKNSGHAALVHTSIGSLGQQITTLPCISAAGDKLTLSVVVKGKTPRCLKRILADASPALQRVRFYFSPKGWVNEQIMLEWLRDVVQPYTRSAPAALILDSYSSHFTDDVRAAAAAMNLDLIQVPPGATSILQPLDVQYNSTLLNARKKIWRETKQWDALAEDSQRAAIERQSIAYSVRTRAEGVAAFEKAYLLPA
jgi:hypothetical protein